MAQLVKANRAENIPVLSGSLVRIFDVISKLSTKGEADVRKQALEFVSVDYIRTFDVIYAVNLNINFRPKRVPLGFSGTVE